MNSIILKPIVHQVNKTLLDSYSYLGNIFTLLSTGGMSTQKCDH